MMRILKFIFISFVAFYATASFAAVPVTTDSRIKTYVYNENEVYLLVLHYGYQSSIEFGKNEEIQTISLGDTYSWKITPIGRRLFIKPLEESIHTNMTVITNKRTYQFDLASKVNDGGHADRELAYVVKFYYPDLKAIRPLVAPAQDVDENVIYDYSVNQ